MTVAEAVADWLAEKEIRHAFGIIGAGNISLWDAIARKGATQIISTHHEQAAAMSASFYQRVSGRIAVCLVTTGAGSTNAISGVMAAWMDSTPLLVISGNETAASLRADTRTLGVQGYDSQELASHFCKQSYRIATYEFAGTRPGMQDNVLKYAWHALTDRRHGPVWIDLPRDVQIAQI